MPVVAAYIITGPTALTQATFLVPAEPGRALRQLQPREGRSKPGLVGRGGPPGRLDRGRDFEAQLHRLVQRWNQDRGGN